MDDLPRGAVTFLFTDIEGSTRLVKQLRGDYGEVLAAHQRLLREAFAQHGGHEIDTQGDAFFVAFSSAREAVLAAVEGQRALTGYPWPNGAAVKVRMGIHTGQAAPVDGRYTGLAVHRAARIAAAGHGGQVLVSQATQTLLEDEEEDLAVTLDDLGSQRLKDLDRPVRLYQLAAPGLESEFPPVRGEDEAPPTEAPQPLHRRNPLALAGASVALVLAAVLAVVLFTRGAGGPATVEPNRVGAIDPGSNRVAEQVDVGLGPGPLAVGNGFVWVGNVDDRNRIVTQVALATHANAGTVPIDNRTPTGITAGPLGVWVAQGRVGSLARIDPQFGRLITTKDNVAGPSGSGSVTTGGGSVWAVYGESTLVRVNPATNGVLGTGVVGGRPTGVVYANGLVWVVSAAPPEVNGYSPGTFAQGPVTGPFTVGQQPVGIAYGYGNLWVANGDGTVTRIDPTGTGSGTITVGGRLTAIATGEGAVWVASDDGTISRIDPAQRKVVKTIDVANPVAGVAVGGGLVWISVQARA